jgi:mRNA guanylyltransferase
MANATGPVPSISAPGVKIDGDLLYNMRSEVASLLGRKQLNFPGAQPVSFARRHLEELTHQEQVQNVQNTYACMS